MFTVDINGTAYPVRFGMNFVREINARVTIPVEAWGGKEENVGLRYYIAQIIDGNLEALQQVIFVANKTESPKLTTTIINDWFEDENTDIDAVFEQVMDFLSRANCTKRVCKQIKEAVEEQQNQNQ